MNSAAIKSIGAATALFAIVLCTSPLVMLALVSTTANWPLGVWAEGFTLNWLTDAALRLLPCLGVSLRIAVVALSITICIGMPAAYGLARTTLGRSATMRGMTQLPLGIPGIALGLALLLTFPWAKASGLLILVAHVLYVLPFFVATVSILNHYRRRRLQIFWRSA